MGLRPAAFLAGRAQATMPAAPTTRITPRWVSGSKGVTVTDDPDYDRPIDSVGQVQLPAQRIGAVEILLNERLVHESFCRGPV